jgi:hypothetical protein
MYHTGHGCLYFSESPEGDSTAAEWGLATASAPTVANQTVRYTEVGPGLLRLDLYPKVEKCG